MIARVATLVLSLSFIELVRSFDSSNIVFIIVSQREPYHASVARRLKLDIENQIQQLDRGSAQVHITHEDFPIPGAWTILPLLRPILNRYKGSDVRWALFIEPHTAVRCGKLVEALTAVDNDQDTMWIGYPLGDDEPTIIHHFAMFEDLEEEGGFVYPYFASGFAMRMKLMDTLLYQIDSGQRQIAEEFSNFSIDPSFELASLIYGDSRNPGPLLKADLSFCIEPAENCATYPRPFDICGSPIPEKSIYFAVKTWHEFHSTRVKVVKKSWGRYVTNLMFYSDMTDPSLPSVNTGIPNVETGHCLKTVAILNMVLNEIKDMPHIQWVFIADDDTILGVQRLTEVLSCYRGGADLTIVGERYGFAYGNKEMVSKGHDYITLGGGAAFSVGAVSKLVPCACAFPAAPDDITLAQCGLPANITLVHSPLFHQGRPQDYPREVLARDRPVTFHRHSSPDPLRVYATWFQHHDLALRHSRRDDL